MTNVELRRNGGVRRWWGLALRLAAGALAASALGVLASAAPVQARAAEQAPAGLDLSQYKGKVIYLDFWASWCGPCKLSFPFMAHLRADYSDRDLVIIAVNVDHSKDKADRFLSAFDPRFQILFDNAGALATRFKVKEMPTAMVIGRDGKVRYIHQGFFADQTEKYEEHVAEVVSGK